MIRISRRVFGKVTLGGLSGLAIARAAGLAAEKARSSLFGGVQIGVMTYSFRDRPLDKALEEIVRIGFSSVELFSGHLDPLKASDAEMVKCWVRSTGLTCRYYYGGRFALDRSSGYRIVPQH